MEGLCCFSNLNNFSGRSAALGLLTQHFNFEIIVKKGILVFVHISSIQMAVIVLLLSLRFNSHYINTMQICVVTLHGT